MVGAGFQSLVGGGSGIVKAGTEMEMGTGTAGDSTAGGGLEQGGGL